MWSKDKGPLFQLESFYVLKERRGATARTDPDFKVFLVTIEGVEFVLERVVSILRRFVSSSTTESRLVCAAC